MEKLFEKYSVGVIGIGVLGSEVCNYYANSISIDKVFSNDWGPTFEEIQQIKEVCSCDYVFVCVPTPSSKGALIVEECVRQVDLFKGDSTIVVIKSTMPIGSTQILQDLYPKLPIVYCPEFLTESTSKMDFRNPDKTIIGYTKKLRLEFHVVHKVRNILPRSPYVSMVDSTSAEIIKLSINSYYAMKVVFGNLVYDICEREGVDYDLVKDAIVSDKRITDSHLDVFHGGYRGFGGKCISKDLSHFASCLEGKAFELVEQIFKYNGGLK